MGSPADAYRLMVEARNQKPAEVETPEQEDIQELSKATLSSYVKGASASAAGIASGVGRDIGAGKKAHADDTRQLRNRMKGVQRAADKLAKENADWPIYSRILEKTSRADHVKGATPPQPHGDNWAGRDREFVAKHGGVGPHTPPKNFDDFEIDVHPDNGATKNVKVAPKRHNDKDVGDKTMPKQAK